MLKPTKRFASPLPLDPSYDFLTLAWVGSPRTEPISSSLLFFSSFLSFSFSGRAAASPARTFSPTLQRVDRAPAATTRS